MSRNKATGPLRRTAGLFIDAAKDFGADDALTHAAALALYTAVSLAPLVVLIVFSGNFLGDGSRRAFLGQVSGLVGPLGGSAIDAIAESAFEDFESRRTPVAVALAVTAFSATAVFAQLQQALNHVWDVKPVPGWNPWGWLKKRLLSFGMLAVTGFLLLVSLAVSTGLSMVFTEEAWIWRVAEFAVSVLVFTAMFAATFRLLPDVRIAWRETLLGASVTAVLFVLGKFAIGTYLGLSSIGRAYGAMGSLLALLVWVYWSSAIVLYGAELTQVVANRRRDVKPRGPAVKVAPPV